MADMCKRRRYLTGRNGDHVWMDKDETGRKEWRLLGEKMGVIE